MQPRLKVVAPAAYHAMLALEEYVRKSSRLEPSLLNWFCMCIPDQWMRLLVWICTARTRANGETEQRLYAHAVARNTILHGSRACRACLDSGDW